jgi:hypothetical protein
MATIEERLKAFEHRLAGWTISELRAEATKLQLLCKRNTRQSLIDALVQWRRAKLEQIHEEE